MTFELHAGDCLDMLRGLPAASVDALVTDPPSGIGFMGAEWDSDRGGRSAWITWLTDRLIWAERAMKPGAHGLVWALPRTQHWTMFAIENAGFEIRDVITHHFASGYPKSTNVGDGLGTALKPASEAWILCRKTLGEDSVTANVKRFGVGALRIDAARVPLLGEKPPTGSGNGSQRSLLEQVARSEGNGGNETPEGGRWPANVVFSHAEECVELGAAKVKGTNPPGPGKHRRVGYRTGIAGGEIARYADKDGNETVPLFACVPGCPVRDLDEQSGVSRSGRMAAGTVRKPSRSNALGDFAGIATAHDIYADEGRASRFFFCAKPSRAERNRGISPHTLWRREKNGLLVPITRGEWSALPLTERAEMNAHPTVKSVSLMRLFTRLIAAPGQRVLDPFTGSGTGGVAAIEEGCSYIGAEEYEPYRELIARPRIKTAAMLVARGVRPAERRKRNA